MRFFLLYLCFSWLNVLSILKSASVIMRNRSVLEPLEVGEYIIRAYIDLQPTPLLFPTAGRMPFEIFPTSPNFWLNLLSFHTFFYKSYLKKKRIYFIRTYIFFTVNDIYS